LEQNLKIYNQYVYEYNDYQLYPPERVFIQRFKDSWHRCSMLDIGVGTGRTTYTFSAIMGKYVAIDYAEEMLNQCRNIIPKSDTITFHHCDARDLSKFYDEKFDFVMFSLNGLDSVGFEDREQILKEVRKVLAPDGYFFFSTHSVRGFTTTRQLPEFKLSIPVHSVYYLAKGLLFNTRLKWAHRNIQVDEIRKCDWAVLKTGDHDFKMDIFHVDPEFQIQELSRLGYQVDSIYDPKGRKADPATTNANWLYYLCQPDTGTIRKRSE